MLDITIKDLAQATSAEIIAAGSGRVSGKTVIDSREVEPGALFVAFRGERSDGNRYARAAIDAGASAVVLSDVPEEGLAAYAEDKGAALLRAAAKRRGALFAFSGSGGRRRRQPAGRWPHLSGRRICR